MLTRWPIRILWRFGFLDGCWTGVIDKSDSSRGKISRNVAIVGARKDQDGANMNQEGANMDSRQAKMYKHEAKKRAGDLPNMWP